MTFQYKTGGSWLNIPSSAYHGTMAGTFEFQYPQSDDYDGWGRPASGLGKPTVIMRSQIMSASGMEFWKAFFADIQVAHASASLTALNSRTGNWEKYSGFLTRPMWRRTQVGSACQNTLYLGFEVSLEYCESTT